MSSEVKLRPFPYPFRAALTICSDIDETENSAEFLAIQQFLNTTDPTSMGRGVGLEIGNSFYFYDDYREFSYFTGDSHAKGIIRELIRSGHLDVLHSYGDAANSRSKITHALDELARNDCRLEVWVNHYGARNNIGGKFDYMLTRGEGDIPGSTTYHTDHTIPFGIRYAWVGAMTRQIGQDAASNKGTAIGTVWDRQHRRVSAVATAKEGRKWMLGRMGDRRFKLHRSNRLTQPLRLRDGQQVHEFQRYGHHPISVSAGATSVGLAYMISAENLNKLVDRAGYMIAYSHFGKNKGVQGVIAPETRQALNHLADMQTDGHIYVTTTAKLLNYYTKRRYLNFSATVNPETRVARIVIHGVNDPVSPHQSLAYESLQGLTFYVPRADRAEIWIRNKRVTSIQRNERDQTGRASVSIPLQRLTYPF
ncbi:MAG: hypothetical protein ACPG8W_20335 [Candidatus Promineifilaceae bacterium]